MNAFAVGRAVLVEGKVFVAWRHGRFHRECASYIKLLELHSRILDRLDVVIDVSESLPDSEFTGRR